MTKESEQWPEAIRIVHLGGGCRAINNPGPIVNLEPITLQGKREKFKIDRYGAIYNNLEGLHISIVGVDFYSHILQVKGIVLPNWRSFHRTKKLHGLLRKLLKNGTILAMLHLRKRMDSFGILEAELGIN